MSDRYLTSDAMFQGFFLPSNMANLSTYLHNNSNSNNNNNGPGDTMKNEAFRDEKSSEHQPPRNFTQHSNSTQYQRNHLATRHHRSNGSHHFNDQYPHLRSKVSPCSLGRINSMTWLEHPRAHVNSEGITRELEHLLIVGTTRFDMIPDLLKESLCHGNSTFCNIPSNEIQPSMSSINEWVPRLFFLAMHWRFHQPALEEFQRRETCSGNNTDSLDAGALLLRQYGHDTKKDSLTLPGRLEYECPKAKFLVMNLPSVGFGAVLNSIVLFATLTAFRSDRIPVLRSVDEGRRRWLLSPPDCKSSDMQCYFLPFSPCTLSQSDIFNGHRIGMTSPDQRELRRSMEIPTELQNERVLLLDIGVIPPPIEFEQIHEDIINTTVTVARELLAMWKKNSAVFADESPTLPKNESPWRVIELAIEFMEGKKTIRDIGYEATYVYMLRPNPVYKRVLLNQTNSILPAYGDYKNSVGIPIRGSDKCNKESTCLAFETFMDLATDTYHETSSSSSYDGKFSTLLPPSHRPKLVLTTEDPAIFQQANTLRLNASFPYDIIINDNDNLQGSGAPKFFRHGQFPNVAKDTIISSLVSLQMQLTPGTVYGNCCSNWHKVIWKFILAGCSAHSDTLFKCLNEGPPPMNNSKYRLCCEWKRDGECRQLYSDYQDAKIKN
jgi:hypothetical protein